MKPYTYLLLNLIIIFFPLLRSFEDKINYYRNWKFIFPGIFFTASFFITWDIVFTEMNIWHFNPDYITGIYILNLPIEEWLFFFTVPYSCLFIYEALNFYLKKDFIQSYSKNISLVLIGLFLTVTILNYSKLYTALSMLISSLILIFHYYFFRDKLLGRFYFAYLIHLIPFFIFNGVLTSLPVVMYNNTENIGIRIGTIPLEDMVYSMSLLLMNISFYEYFKCKRIKNESYSN